MDISPSTVATVLITCLCIPTLSLADPDVFEHSDGRRAFSRCRWHQTLGERESCAYRKYEKYNLSVPDMNLLLKKLLVRTRIVPKFKFPPELNCTTTRSVQFFRSIDIPEERTSNSTRNAILAALENDQMWTWRHERTEGKTTYVGLKVRSHYIQAAIIQNQGEIITILCDSKNVRQRKTSIHRNVKKWKEDLDKRIHSQLLKAPDERSRSEPNISDEVLQLLRLHKKGIVTDAELEMLLRRLVSPDQSPAP